MGLKDISDAVDGFLTRKYKELGYIIHDHTTLFIVIPLLLLGLGAIGMVQLEIEYNAEKLYTPQDSESFDHQDIVEADFGFSDTNFDIYETDVGNKGANILTKAGLLRFQDAYDAMVSVSGTYQEETKTFATACRRVNNACDVSSVLSFWNYNRAALEAETEASIIVKINTPTIDALGRPIELQQILGGTVTNDAGDVVEAKAFKMTSYFVTNEKQWSDGQDEDRATNEYVRAMSKTVRAINDQSGTNFEVYTMSDTERGEESEGAIAGDILLISVGYILLLGYSYLVLSRRSLVHSHGSLVMASALCVLISILASFGALNFFGVPFSLSSQVLAFLLLGLGIDDTFVLMAAFQSQPRSLTARERVARALSKGGASITVTSLTDVCAFAAGASSTIPAIQAFCLFATAGVLFDFVLQVTTFVAFMVLSHRREEKGKADLCCCIVPDDPEKILCGKDGETYDPDQIPPLTRFLEAVTRFTLTVPGTVLVLAITIGVVAASTWGSTQVGSNFSIDWFVPDGSYLQDTFAVRDDYFKGEFSPFGMYTQQVDYPSLQSSLDKITTGLATDDTVLSCENWWTAYKSYVSTTSPGDVAADGTITTASFYPNLKAFLAAPAGSTYADRVVFTSDNTVVKAAEIYCFNQASTDADLQIDHMDSARAIADSVPELEAFAFAFPYVFLDGVKVIKDQILLNILTAAIAVLIICLVLLANGYAAIIVLGSLALTDVNVLGFLYFYGLDFNTVSAVNLVIAVGLAVDSSAHIMHAFLVAQGSKKERAMQAITSMGRSVTNGAVSTFLAILPLAFSASYIFKVFFRCLITIIGFSFWHGVVVLPVVLALIGPQPYSEKIHLDEDEKGTEMNKVKTQQV